MADWIDTGWHWLKGAILVTIVLFLVLFVLSFATQHRSATTTQPSSTTEPSSKTQLSEVSEVSNYLDRVHKSGLILDLNCDSGIARVTGGWEIMRPGERARFRSMMGIECGRPVEVEYRGRIDP